MHVCTYTCILIIANTECGTLGHACQMLYLMETITTSPALLFVNSQTRSYHLVKLTLNSGWPQTSNPPVSVSAITAGMSIHTNPSDWCVHAHALEYVLMVPTWRSGDNLWDWFSPSTTCVPGDQA